MSVEVVEVSPQENEEWRNVISWVYARRPPEPGQYPLEPGETRYLARVNGQAAGACTVYDYTIVRQEANLTCGGVAAVATLSEHRRKGVGDALMKSILASMRNKGQVVSALYPYRESYYRRFGYATCGWRWQIKSPQGRFPDVESKLPVRQIDPAEIASLDAVYVPFIRSRSGSPLRTPADWTSRLGKKSPMIYAIGDPMEAYLWANFEDFWGEVNVGEIAWTTRAGYETALSVIGAMCSNQSAAVWNEPPDSPFLSSFLDQGITASTSRASMFRILDVPAALSRLKPTTRGSFSVEIDDVVCDWNSGIWTITFDECGVRAEKGASAGLRMSIAALSQAFMGQPCLHQLVREGLVQVLEENALDAAAQLFEPLAVVCMEFF